MKNWRIDMHDVSPPIHHDDLSPRRSRIGFGGMAIEIGPGPYLIRVPSAYTPPKELA